MPLKRLPRIRGGRETATIAVHPRVKRELKRLAKRRGCSVSYLIVTMLVREWTWIEPGDH